jgi:hypothetical protein
MKTLVKSAIVALALAGASVAVAPAPAQAASSFGFYVGPDGGRMYFNQGFYRDRYGHRHYYRYPRDWRRYGYSRDWYRTHPRWYRDRNWYRR